MFRSRRSLRRWTIQVLLVWFFGMAVGIAHACALRLADHHHDGIAALAADHADAAHGHAEAPGDEGAAEANCLDFCDKSSVSTPSLKFNVDLTGDLQPVALLWSPLPAMADGPTRIAPQLDGVIDRRGGPPLRISLQRLAL